MDVLAKYKKNLEEKLSELDDRETAIKRGKLLIEAKLKDLNKAWSKEQKGGTEVYKKVMGQEIIRKKKVFQKKTANELEPAPKKTESVPAVAAGVPEVDLKDEKKSSFFPWS